jgi:hypothetical protein
MLEYLTERPTRLADLAGDCLSLARAFPSAADVATLAALVRDASHLQSDIAEEGRTLRIPIASVLGRSLADAVRAWASASQNGWYLCPDRHILHVDMLSKDIHRAVMLNIFCHLRGPDGNWYPHPDERDDNGAEDDENVRDGEGGEVPIGGETVTKKAATKEEVDGLKLKEAKGTNPVVIDRGDKGEQYMFVVKFSFKPTTLCDAAPPYTIIQTVSTLIADIDNDKKLAQFQTIEENPKFDPFAPKADANGDVSWMDTPGPNIKELHDRHPGVTHFLVAMTFWTYVRDNCTNRLIAHFKWTIYFDIKLDNTGKIDKEKSKALLE